MSQTAYWPWPPDCLTCRPWPVGRRRRTSRAAAPAPARTRPRRRSGCAAGRAARRACASPMHHSTSWWVSGLRSSRSVGSSATSRPRPCDSLSSSALDLRDDRRPAAAARASPRAPSAAGRPCRTGCRRSRRGPSLATAHDVAGDRTGRPCAGSCRAARTSAPTRSSTSWSSWPRSARQWPDTCTVGVRAQGAGEDPDQRDPADVRVGRGLDDLGDQRAGRVAGQRRRAGRRRAW